MTRYRIIIVIVGMLWGTQVFHTEAAVVINEVLADPPTGDKGDANRDGIRHSSEDEFVEILNTGSDTLAIGGWELSDRNTKKPFTFPPDTKIAPGEYMVLFGGGDTTKIKSEFEGKIFVDDGTIGGGLTNGGDAVFLITTSSDTIARAEWGKEGGKDQSLVRYPEGTGKWVLHSASPDKELFSPGKPRSFLEKEKSALVISEVYPNPAWGDAGDTNGDGVRHTYQDEFVEVANLGEQPIDISGYFLGDDDASVDQLFQFPDNTVLDTQAVVVLFGGGEVPVSDQIFADDGRIGDGLSNWSDTVQLLAPDSSTVVASMVYERSTRGVSYARDGDGNYLLHNQIYKEESISVGRLGQGDDPIGIVFSEILMLPEQVDANNDGVVNRDEDTFVELTNIGVDTLDLSGWQLGDDDIIVSQFFSFPDNVVLVPGGYLTIFGGGTPVGIPGTVLSAEGQIGNGLSSDGDVVHLLMPDGKTVARSVDVPKATPDVSWLFSPDDPPVLHPQISSRHAMSPGTSPDGQGAARADSINTEAPDIFQSPEGLVISEVYPNPAADDAGDTNRDGVRHTYQDEFVEIANLGVYPIAIGGYYLGDDDVPVEKLFRFPDNTVLDTQAVVVLFGGGEVPVSNRIFADDGRIGDGLSNGGDTVQLLAPDGIAVICSMVYERSTRGVSFARDGDGNYLLHNQIYEEVPASVGRLKPGDNPIETEGLTETLAVPDGLVFSEILMLPEQVDANNDGVVDKHADAFVELVNIGVDTLDLSGWLLGDDDIIVSRFFPIPDDVVLVPGGYITIFGGGTPVGIPGTVLSAEGQIGNGFSSGGDVVRLIMPDGKTAVRSVRVPKATPDVSWLFPPDAPPELHPQISGGRAMSPGTQPISKVETDTLNSVANEGAMSGKPIVFDVEDQMANSSISDDSKPGEVEIENPKWGIYPSPNPFNTATVLDFYTAGGPVDVIIYNILGQPIRRLVQQHLPAGYYRRIWDGKNDSGVSVGSGIYIVLLKDKKATFTQRVALLK